MAPAQAVNQTGSNRPALLIRKAYGMTGPGQQATDVEHGQGVAPTSALSPEVEMLEASVSSLPPRRLDAAGVTADAQLTSQGNL